MGLLRDLCANLGALCGKKNEALKINRNRRKGRASKVAEKYDFIKKVRRRLGLLRGLCANLSVLSG